MPAALAQWPHLAAQARCEVGAGEVRLAAAVKDVREMLVVRRNNTPRPGDRAREDERLRQEVGAAVHYTLLYIFIVILCQF